MSNNDIVATGTPRSSESSPRAPLWAPPKSPLPPNRLAKLANALGVSTPVHHYPNYPSSPITNLSPASLQPPESFRRSPSPSASSMNLSAHSPTTSKFLLHVIPPLSLPHDSDFIERFNLTPPPPTASGYHTQFRRGTLVPVHSTFQAQLWAIAREYALPSIAGIVLYLVSNPNASAHNSGEEDWHEPGPRLSEAIWKHLWTRVWKAERDESLTSPISPGVVGLGLGIGARSTPHLLQEGNVLTSNGRPLKQLLSSSSSSDSAHSFGAPYPSPSTPSPTSDTPARDRYPLRSTSSQSFSSGTETADTSLPSDDQSTRANSLDLPGLNSPGIIPILAKVEFDIDRKKAGWYGPWLRSRKMNHVKRKKAVRSNSTNSVESSEIRVPPIALKLKGRAMTASPISMFERNGDGYEPLEDESEESGEGSNYDDDDDLTARIASTDMRDHNKFGIDDDPNVVDLALTGGELSALPDQEEDVGRQRDIEEVQEVMTTALHRKNVPPPLVLHNGMTSRELYIPSPHDSGNSSDSTALAYLKGESPSNDVAIKAGEDELADGEYRPLKSTTDEKRVGGVFEALDLGLDPSEDFDDRRNSQYLFSEQLDELERNLEQLSPRALKVDLDNQQNPGLVNEQFLNLPSGAIRNSDVLPSSPRKDTSEVKIENTTEPPRSTEAKVTAPVLAVNGVTTTASPPRKPSLSVGLLLPTRNAKSEESPIIPLSPDPFGRYPSSPAPANSNRISNAYWDSAPVGTSTENLKRYRESVSTTGKQETRPLSTKSSRFSTDSTNDDGEEVQVKGKGGVSMKSIKRLWRKSNKNSVASVSSLPPVPPTPTIATAPLVPSSLAAQQQVASKSTPELSLSSPTEPHFRYPSPTARSASPNQLSARPPLRPPRPSQEDIEFPDIPDQLTIPLQPASGRLAPIPIIAAQMIHGTRSQDSGLDRLHFDQESPYPTTKMKGSSSRPVSPTSAALQPSPTPPPPLPENANGNGVIPSNRASIRKSIFKWKSAAQLGGETGRPRKSSIASLVPNKSSGSGYSENIPPSPSIPEHFLQSRSHSHSSVDSKTDSLQSIIPRTSNSSATSTASPLPRTSKDSIPNSDDSQFEIISPKDFRGL
ncbi:hypothetical protein E1B28_001627 [Marasmius oreades]|uniref:Uncharacterized protein n=1 Tax=Marasmius oreades TaxID=181124 RepID=A0A9P7V3R3_9AGAR|nr:uncharacterized protein E1B28_001627 [Marasmius oreades]KAG7099816.1 hypothetical protein E1B28_001627 [Marasmius oreades]